MDTRCISRGNTPIYTRSASQRIEKERTSCVRHFMPATAAAAALILAQPASADTVCDWMDFANRSRRRAQASERPRRHARPAARRQPHRARHVRSAERDRPALPMLSRLSEPATRRRRRTPRRRRPPTRFCSTTSPAQRTALEESYTLAMAGDPGRRGAEAGRLIGEARRPRRSRPAGSIPPSPRSPIGRARRPASGSAPRLPPIEPYMSAFRPWAIPSAEALRPPPPPALTSAALGPRL